MPYIEITRETFLSALPVKVGEVYEVTKDVADIAVGAACAKIVEQPDEVIEAPKPAKPRKITKKKADEKKPEDSKE